MRPYISAVRGVVVFIFFKIINRMAGRMNVFFHKNKNCMRPYISAVRGAVVFIFFKIINRWQRGVASKPAV